MRHARIALLLMLAAGRGAGAQVPQRAADSNQVTVGAPLIVSTAPLTGREDIAVRSHVVPSRVFVGQQATYEVGVFLSDESRERMRRNPEFVPPEMRSMLTYDLSASGQTPSRVVNGRRYEVHVFRRALFPLAAGLLEIPPARLNYALPLSSSFFSREELHTERTQSTVLEVVEPPVVGRPPAYRGAVGRLGLDARIDNRRGRVGDPLLLTVTVSGVGNLSLVPRPELTVPWGDAVPGPERIRIDSTNALAGGRKEFDFLVTPRRPGLLVVPAIEYAYFDPYSATYQVTVSQPLSVVVASGSAVASERFDADSVALLPIRRAYRGELSPPLPASRWYWLVLLLTPVPALVLATLRRPRAVKTETPLMRIQAMAARDTVSASDLRRDFALALSRRVPGTASTLSNHTRLARALRRAGVTPDVAADAGRLLAELDGAVFGNAGPLPGDTARRVAGILQAIDEEALPTHDIVRVGERVAKSAIMTVAVGTVALTPLLAFAPTDFSRGVQAYDTRDLAAARSLFAAETEAHARAADAWANYGTVAWQLGDTAHAAVGWQRALRLEPTAEDVRDYLEFVPGFEGRWFGDVPPIPLGLLAVVGGLAWIVGCYAFALAGRDRVRRRTGIALVAGAFATALVGLSLNDVATGRHAAIVATGGQLRAAPMLTSETSAEVLAGELARTTGEQTAWTRVRFRDGRSGWLQSRDLISLQSPR